MTLYKWSQTANNNGSADSTCPWPEGMAPSQVNDSSRGNMAAIAKYRDDIAGAIVTGGTSTAYTVTSYEVFDTLAHLNGMMIAFSPHATNGATVTLNVDGLGTKPLRTAPNAELLAGVLIQGTPYIATYNNSDGAFYLKGFYGNPYNIPLGSSLDYWLTTAPNSSFAFPYGQAISRTTYAPLFSAMGTTFGAGDGSTTFNIPDLRGRAVASPDNMGGSDAGRMTASASMTSVRNSLGGAGGAASVTLDQTMIPAHTHTATDSGHTHPQASNTLVASGGAGNYGPGANPISAAASNTGTGTANITVQNTGGGLAHDNIGPRILANRILRII